MFLDRALKGKPLDGSEDTPLGRGKRARFPNRLFHDESDMEMMDEEDEEDVTVSVTLVHDACTSLLPLNRDVEYSPTCTVHQLVYYVLVYLS